MKRNPAKPIKPLTINSSSSSLLNRPIDQSISQSVTCSIFSWPWPWPKAEEGGAAQGMDDVDPAREASDLDIQSSTSGIDMSTNYEVF